MDPAIPARALHVLGVVLWIGGVAFFAAIEGRSAWQDRVTTLLVGATGFHLIAAWDLWHRFATPAYWWMHAMVAVWAIVTVMLLIAEPLFLPAGSWSAQSATRSALSAASSGCTGCC